MRTYVAQLFSVPQRDISSCSAAWAAANKPTSSAGKRLEEESQ